MMQFSFTNKVAIITGSAIGIGFEIARQLAHVGASVVINDIDGDALEKAVATIKSTGGKCISVEGSSAKSDTINKLVNRAVLEFGRLDFIIANAGITTFGNFLDYKQEAFKMLTAVNLQGSFFFGSGS